jgi:hypothetical protein
MNWGGARVVDWGRLLSGYWGEILSRRFESCPPRYKPKRVRDGAFLLSLVGPLTGDDIRILRLRLAATRNHARDFQRRVFDFYLRLNFIPKCVPLKPSPS